MSAFARVLENFISFKRVPLKVVLITALASYMLQLGMIIQGQPLYIIVLFTLLPWIPVLMFESIWKIQHYHWIAFFAVITALQLGHLGEHVLQVTQLGVMNGTLACPPPVDNPTNAQNAIDNGLRLADDGPTLISSSLVIVPGSDGLPLTDACGDVVTGPPACGVFNRREL